MARKKPDKLSQDVSKAIAAKMSYGKWMAMQEPVKVEKKIPEGWKVCPWCGKQFKPRNGKIYCELECRVQAYAEKERAMRREHMRKYRAERGAC